MWKNLSQQNNFKTLSFDSSHRYVYKWPIIEISHDNWVSFVNVIVLVNEKFLAKYYPLLNTLKMCSSQT